jgi:hypothetical protein
MLTSIGSVTGVTNLVIERKAIVEAGRYGLQIASPCPGSVAVPFAPPEHRS